MGKKKVVVIIMLLLTAAMLALLYIRFKTNWLEPSPSAKKSPVTTATQATPTSPAPGEAVEPAAGAGSATAPLAGSAGAAPSGPTTPTPPVVAAVQPAKEIKALTEITWKPIDTTKVIFDSYLVTFWDLHGNTVGQIKLPQSVTSLKLQEVPFLKENGTYSYEVTPLNSGQNVRSYAEQAGIGIERHFFARNFVNDPPTPAVVTSPRSGDVVNKLPLTVSWRAAEDPDPGEKITYIITLVDRSNPNAAPVTIQAGPGSSISLSRQLLENHRYRLVVTARDIKGAVSKSASVSFAVNTRLEPPSSPQKLQAVTAKNAVVLSWSKSYDPDPVADAGIKGYQVRVIDTGTGKTVARKFVAAKYNTWSFNQGTYGRSYRFEVTAVSNTGRKAASGTSKAFKYTVYKYRPKFVVPANSGDKLRITDSLKWTAGPEVVSYQLLVNEVPVGGIKSNQFQLSAVFANRRIKRSYGTRYVVRVRGVRADQSMTPYSNEMNFELINSPPTRPRELQPSKPPTRETTAMKDFITWIPSRDPDGERIDYWVEFSPFRNFNRIPLVIKITGKPYNKIEFKYHWDQLRSLPEGLYYIRVRAQDSAGNRSYSKPLPYTLKTNFLGI